jgi:hypothetical protein
MFERKMPRKKYKSNSLLNFCYLILGYDASLIDFGLSCELSLIVHRPKLTQATVVLFRVAHAAS